MQLNNKHISVIIMGCLFFYLVTSIWHQHVHIWKLTQRLLTLERDLHMAHGIISHDVVTKKKWNKKKLPSRLDYIDIKLNGHLSWGIDPHMWDKIVYSCNSMILVDENSPECRNCFPICSDFWDRSQFCIVYEFGIRKDPSFGVRMANDYGCEVHAFDPSPITIDWWKKEGKNVQKQAGPKYYMHLYGAGQHDGMFDLFQYTRDQISIRRKSPQPFHKRPHVSEKRVPVPLKKMDTIMKNLNHSHIFYLKLDVEGSEYMFLSNMFDSFSERPFDMLSVEFHHFNHDTRYGSSPGITSFVLFLRKWHVYLFHQTPQNLLKYEEVYGYHAKVMSFLYVPPKYRDRVNKTGWFEWNTFH